MKRLRPGMGIGIDICQISRIASILGSPRRARFLSRILTPDERAGGEARLKAPLKEEAAFVAGRFAAKEAVMKAFSSTRRLGWQDIEIDIVGARPVGRVVGRGEGDGGGEEVLVSISHDGDYAAAFCVAGVT
ncbi:hypothetical protein L249_8895 [Ophiocordyceps polyrhachis-furcata BCC 54312]|uniref:4'-phosphopantetheinyl transferase domain-containing protein n=1 Tax=Ophiocordyceps polyrhachis-furcata BCC 54312 TaxID=1330021 RepID=A0A367L1T9_9HYPO|nr:hypothetical protein L249_8895 [Ophiocordyceps polyrhachis-furcata BCC 54312]